MTNITCDADGQNGTLSGQCLIDTQMEVMVYEQAEEIVRAQENIVVAPCICRQERQMVGEGCGLCVSTCPTETLTLARKPEGERPSIPKNTVMTHIQLGRARGKLKTTDMVMLAVWSKVDRLLARG